MVLQDACDLYHYLLSNSSIDDDTFEIASNRFMVSVKKLENDSDVSFVPILQKLVDHFPKKLQYKKQLGLDYAKDDETIVEAIELFEDILNQNDTLGKKKFGKYNQKTIK